MAKKSVKKTRKKAAKPKVLGNAPKDKYFVLSDGNSVKSVKELADKLEGDVDSFNHHTDDRNDFADWIEHVFNSKKLADNVRSKKDLDSFRLEIYKFLLECK